MNDQKPKPLTPTLSPGHAGGEGAQRSVAMLMSRRAAAIDSLSPELRSGERAGVRGRLVGSN